MYTRHCIANEVQRVLNIFAFTLIKLPDKNNQQTNKFLFRRINCHCFATRSSNFSMKSFRLSSKSLENSMRFIDVPRTSDAHCMSYVTNNMIFALETVYLKTNKAKSKITTEGVNGEDDCSTDKAKKKKTHTHSRLFISTLSKFGGLPIHIHVFIAVVVCCFLCFCCAKPPFVCMWKCICVWLWWLCGLSLVVIGFVVVAIVVSVASRSMLSAWIIILSNKWRRTRIVVAIATVIVAVVVGPFPHHHHHYYYTTAILVMCLHCHRKIHTRWGVYDYSLMFRFHFVPAQISLLLIDRMLMIVCQFD